MMILVDLPFVQNLFAIKSLQTPAQSQKFDKIAQEVFKKKLL